MLKVLSGSLKNLPRRSWLGFTLAFSAILFIFLWHLGNLTPGLSAQEVNYSNLSVHLSSILSSPVNAPHRLIQFVIFKAAPQHPSLLRLASVFWALIFCFAFYRLATGWFGRAIGFFSTLVFASLPLFVISGRQATAAVMFFCPVVLISLYGWLLRTKRHKAAAWLGLCLASGVFMYTPGLLVWVLASFIICRKQIIKAIADVPFQFSFLGVLFVFAAISSLAFSSFTHRGLAKEFLLVPAHLGSWVDALKHTGWMISALFVKTGQTSPVVIRHLPLLSIILIAMLVFGLYAMLNAAKSKALWLAAGVIYAIAEAGVNNEISLLALGLPSILLFTAAGLRYLYIEWRSVFPRNPIPKNFALVLIALVALVQVYFGLRYALAAWPGEPATRAVYMLK